MADVDQVFRDRWRGRKQVGQNAPHQYARVRTIDMDHGYRPFTFLDGSTEEFGSIPKSNDHAPWWPLMVPQTDWVTLPNVTSVQKGQGFDNNGFQTVTVELENVVYKTIVGIAGIYHAISRGDLSPWRGFKSFGRPDFAEWMHQQNEWYDIIDGAQIDIWQGYGAGHDVRVFSGLVEEVDMTSNPDHMTLTCTCFGDQFLGRQKFFGTAKDPKLRPPITFADRLSAYDVRYRSAPGRASSEEPGYPAGPVAYMSGLDWISDGRSTPDATEWVEVKLPKGNYEVFGMWPLWSGMEVYVGLKIADRTAHPQKNAKVDGNEVAAGWFDPDGTNVPGATNGGWPYFMHLKNVPNRNQRHAFGHKFEVGDGTILRLGFRNLHKHPMSGRDPGQPYRAGLQRLFGIERTLKPNAKKNNWVLVDDYADVVKIILRWAGFREWEVEDFGVRLKAPLVFNQSDFFIDAIQKLASFADYVFFMGDPTQHDLSMGVPKFRHTRATMPPGATLVQVRDKDLLTGIQVKLAKSLKAARIFVRGRRAKKGQQGRAQLGQDVSSKGRIGDDYTPPWVRKLSGAKRYAIHTNNFLTTLLDCKVMARLMAMQMALQSNTGQIEIPGNPELELDEQVSVVDEGTGTNTRLWIASRQDTFTTGDQPSWKTTLGGSWIDTHDVLAVTFDLLQALGAQEQAADPTGPPHATGGTTQAHSNGGGVKF